MLLGAFVLQGLATGLMLAGAQYIATWVLDSESAVSVLFAALIAPALICTPLWGAIARRWGKEVGFVAATALFALAAAAGRTRQWSSGPVAGVVPWPSREPPTPGCRHCRWRCCPT